MIIRGLPSPGHLPGGKCKKTAEQSEQAEQITYVIDFIGAFCYAQKTINIEHGQNAERAGLARRLKKRYAVLQRNANDASRRDASFPPRALHV